MKNKKFMSLLALGCGALLLVGCGTSDKEEEKEEKKSTTQTLNCVLSQEESGMVTTAETTFVYNKKDNKMVSGVMAMELDYSEPLKDMTEDEKEQAEAVFESMLGTMCDTFEEQGYVNCKSSFKDSKFEMSMDFDMDNIEDITDGDVTTDMTIDELKEYFEEEDGTVCTIK